MKYLIAFYLLCAACSPTESAPSDLGEKKDLSLTDVGFSPNMDTKGDLKSDPDALDIAKDLGKDGADTADLSDASDVSPDLPPERIPRGTCERDADCKGGPCVTIGETLDGWNTCSLTLSEQTECSQVGDACCKSEDCQDGANGVCLSPLPICTGIRPPTSNICYYDQCSKNADCDQGELGVCIPGGTFGEGAATCFYGRCRIDSDCSEGEEGECIPFQEPCVGRHSGFHCVYKDSECRNDDDCKGVMQYCAPKKKGTACEQFFLPA